MNALNRSIESIVEIGNEFAQVEALWSQFETITGRGQPVDDQDSVKEPQDDRNGDHKT